MDNGYLYSACAQPPLVYLLPDGKGENIRRKIWSCLRNDCCPPPPRPHFRLTTCQNSGGAVEDEMIFFRKWFSLTTLHVDDNNFPTMFPLLNLFHLSFSMCRFSTWMFDQIYRAVLISLVIYVRYTRGAFRFYFLDLPHSLFKLASCLEEISKSSAFDRFPFFFNRFVHLFSSYFLLFYLYFKRDKIFIIRV